VIQRRNGSEDVIRVLNLEAHAEGGYFRRTYQADHRDMLETANGSRY
jgi:predicted cupin superfamily sugar epimerase